MPQPMSRPRRLPSQIDPLRLRSVMGRRVWKTPIPWSPFGWQMDTVAIDSSRGALGRIIVSQSPVEDPAEAQPGVPTDLTEWIHASMSWVDHVPSYDDLCLLKRAVWGDRGEAYQMHVSSDRHVNIHPNTLHLWGRADGARVLPDFGRHGTI
jgi:hypothetical protein